MHKVYNNLLLLIILFYHEQLNHIKYFESLNLLFKKIEIARIEAEPRQQETPYRIYQSYRYNVSWKSLDL